MQRAWRRVVLVLVVTVAGLWLADRFVWPRLLGVRAAEHGRWWLLAVALVCLLAWGYAAVLFTRW